MHLVPPQKGLMERSHCTDELERLPDSHVHHCAADKGPARLRRIFAGLPYQSNPLPAGNTHCSTV